MGAWPRNRASKGFETRNPISLHSKLPSNREAEARARFRATQGRGILLGNRELGEKQSLRNLNSD